MYIVHFDYGENISLFGLIILSLWLSLLGASWFSIRLGKTAKFVNRIKTKSNFPALQSKSQNVSVYARFSKPLFVIKNIGVRLILLDKKL